MKLGQFEIKAGGQFSPDSPVILDWTKSKHINERGDFDTGKTTIIDLLLVAIGQLSGEDVYQQLVNRQTNKLDLTLPFVGKDRLSYICHVTKSGLKLIYEGEALPSPLSKLKELLGVAGVSPMQIKKRPVKEIIKWLATYSNKTPEEFEKQFNKLKDGIKAAQQSRAQANKSAKGLAEYLSNEEMYKNWEQSEKKYAEQPNITELSSRLQKAGDKSDKYIQNESKVKSQKERQKQIEDQIKSLQKELEVVESNIAIGEKWLTSNETAKKDYDLIKKQYDAAHTDVVNYNKWQTIKEKKKELDLFETTSQKADNLEKELLKDQKELQLELLPDLKGVEIVMEDAHEDGKVKKEGFYKDGMSSAQMSETGWWAIVMQIWRKSKVRIVVIDNFQSLGSDGVKRLEELKKDGCYVLTSEMDREQKTLEIEYQ